jgi:uncharacterized protein
MRITGNATLTAAPAVVYQALNDPAVLVRTIPGCHRLEALGEDAYAMTVAAGVGSIKGVYDGQVRLSDQQEPDSFHLHAQGSGAPGTIGADVLVSLVDGPDGGTSLTYDADATVGGMIGGVGQRMLVGVSKRMAAEFFGNVDAALAAGPADVPDGAASEVSGAPSSPDGQPARAPGAVFTAPQKAGGPGLGLGPGFALGVAVGVVAGTAAALVGALVGARIAGRHLR